MPVKSKKENLKFYLIQKSVDLSSAKHFIRSII